MDFALPVVFAVAAWWLSTAVIIYRAGLPSATFVATLLGTTAVAGFGVYALVVSRFDLSASGAYLAFFGALSIWAWHEVSYLFGFVSGPRPQACPPNVVGWRRFVLGVKTCIYHELAVLLTVAAIAVLSVDATNKVGLWTFVVLWLMRWSAKLNIFLGVRNLHEEFWPEHLAYLKSFVRQRDRNELLPISLFLGGIALLVFSLIAYQAGDNLAQRTGAMLLATLIALAMLEHWFLMARVRDDLIWKVAMRSRDGDGPAAH